MLVNQKCTKLKCSKFSESQTCKIKVFYSISISFCSVQWVVALTSLFYFRVLHLCGMWTGLQLVTWA